MPTIRTVRMGTACYHVLHSIPPVIAHELNFFVDEGLVDEDGLPAYELIPGGLAPFNAEKISLAQSMKEKAVSIAMDVKPSTVVYLNRRGAQLRIIAGWRNQQHNWVMAQPGITDLADLRGRRIGVKDFKNIRYYALAPALREAGLEPDGDVEYVRNIQDGAAALREGIVDAAFVARHQAAGMRADGYSALLDLATRSPQGRPDRVIVANEDLIKQRPDWVSAYVRAILRSYWFVRLMPEHHFYVSNLERRLRLHAPDPDERTSPFLACGTPESCEQMPFPIDGTASGFSEYLAEWVELGDLEQEDTEHLPESLRLDLAQQAYQDLSARPEFAAQLTRLRELVDRVGY